mmetsp:Transcript_12699/g.26230  ORF Transcript_12699/g.26230 Transcript_12699/m.26230 type:complete len:154 (+) Transcript_12699:813-1274(+)
MMKDNATIANIMRHCETNSQSNQVDVKKHANYFKCIALLDELIMTQEICPWSSRLLVEEIPGTMLSSHCPPVDGISRYQQGSYLHRIRYILLKYELIIAMKAKFVKSRKEDVRELEKDTLGAFRCAVNTTLKLLLERTISLVELVITSIASTI